MIGSARVGKPSHTFDKTQMCRYFARGRCYHGATCTYAHGEAELKPQPDLYKTRLCVGFIESGACAYGGRCNYAHSRQELRRPTASRRRAEQRIEPTAPTVAVGGSHKTEQLDCQVSPGRQHVRPASLRLRPAVLAAGHRGSHEIEPWLQLRLEPQEDPQRALQEWHLRNLEAICAQLHMWIQAAQATSGITVLEPAQPLVPGVAPEALPVDAVGVKPPARGDKLAPVTPGSGHHRQNVAKCAQAKQIHVSGIEGALQDDVGVKPAAFDDDLALVMPGIGLSRQSTAEGTHVSSSFSRQNTEMFAYDPVEEEVPCVVMTKNTFINVEPRSVSSSRRAASAPPS